MGTDITGMTVSSVDEDTWRHREEINAEKKRMALPSAIGLSAHQHSLTYTQQESRLLSRHFTDWVKFL